MRIDQTMAATARLTRLAAQAERDRRRPIDAPRLPARTWKVDRYGMVRDIDYLETETAD